MVRQVMMTVSCFSKMIDNRGSQVISSGFFGKRTGDANNCIIAINICVLSSHTYVENMLFMV